MKIFKVRLDEGAFMPIKKYKKDAGWDLLTPKYFYLAPNERILMDTGVHIDIPEGYFGKLETKSGLGHRGIIIRYGVIDSGYTGSIKVEIQNISDNYIEFNKGDKICQIIFIKIDDIILDTDEVGCTNSFSFSERGDNGFGSTGK